MSLNIVTTLELRRWDGDLDRIWGIFQELFGGVKGWTQPEVRIINETTGDTMTDLNKEWWCERFALDNYKPFV
jgi:hypothetical protein